MFTKNQKEEIQEIIQETIQKLLVNDELIKAITDKIAITFDSKMKTITEKYELKLHNCQEEIKVLKEKHESMLAEIDDFKQYNMRNKLRIYGIPENNKNLLSEMQHIFLNKMNIQISNNISAYRVDTKNSDKKQDKKPRPIILNFTDIKERQLIYKSKKQLKGTGIVIKEELTSYRLNIYQKACTKYGYKNVWTWNGNIIMNKNGQKHIIKRNDMEDN